MRLLAPFTVLIMILASCSSKNKSESKMDTLTMASPDPVSIPVDTGLFAPPPPTALKKYTGADVAKFTIATVMLKPAKIISVKKSADIYIVSYTRPSDGQKYVYKVKIEGNRAIWANIDGRWRDTPDDEHLTFAETDEGVKITQLFSDGSIDEKVFTK